MTGRRVRNCKQLLDDTKEVRRYSKLKEEAVCGEIVSEEPMDLSQDGLRIE
jgi:hypothetical protein